MGFYSTTPIAFILTQNYVVIRSEAPRFNLRKFESQILSEINFDLKQVSRSSLSEIKFFITSEKTLYAARPESLWDYL